MKPLDSCFVVFGVQHPTLKRSIPFGFVAYCSNSDGPYLQIAQRASVAKDLQLPKILGLAADASYRIIHKRAQERKIRPRRSRSMLEELVSSALEMDRSSFVLYNERNGLEFDESSPTNCDLSREIDDRFNAARDELAGKGVKARSIWAGEPLTVV